VSCLSLSALIEIHTRSEVSPRSLAICMHWPTGSWNAAI
jgi:hypothetical protein